MQKGLMGGFTGRIGNTIGYIVNGVQYVRSAPKKRTGPLSPAQIIQREKFSLMTKFLAPLTSFMNETHKYYIYRKTGYSKHFSLNYHEALIGEYPDFAIDYRRIRLTTGSLAGHSGIHVSCGQKGFLDFHWNDNSCSGQGAYPCDRLLLAFYDEDEKCWEIKNEMALRMDGFLTIQMGNHRGNRLQVYTGFTSPDRQRVSKSQYLGMINVL